VTSPNRSFAGLDLDIRHKRFSENSNGIGGVKGAFFTDDWLRGHDLNVRPSGYEPDELLEQGFDKTKKPHFASRVGLKLG
jgi:hypothetical protein